MPQAEQNLFTFPAETPRGGVAHGKALVTGDAAAAAILRRGIDLSAGASFAGRLGGDLGEMVVGSLDAQAEVGVSAALTAAFPLDLFGEAGLVARFRLQAAASASVRAALELELDLFRELIREQFDAPFDALLEIFLEEARIGAGLWGRAAFSAEIGAQAVLAGSLLGTPDRPAGFSFSAEYGVGWGAGAGVEFAANIGFEDSQRLLGRLADATTDAVLTEVASYLHTRTEAEADAAAPALAVLRIVLPLATASAFRLGAELASAPDAEARDRAAAAVVDSFVARARALVLEATVEYALHRLAEALGEDGLPDPDEFLDPARVDGFVDAVVTLRDLLVPTLHAVTSTDPQRWLSAILDVVDAIERVLAFGFLPADVEADARRASATFWAAGTLAHRAVTVARAPTAEGTFGAVLAPLPTGSTTATFVATALDKPPGSALTLADLAAFLVGESPLAGVRDVVAGADEVCTWLTDATGVPGDQLLGQLLNDLTGPDGTAVDRLLDRLGDSLSHVVAHTVVPDLLNPIRAHQPDNVPLHRFLDELVVPLLVALPDVVIPGLAQVDTAEGRLRLREALSAVLLQSLGEFLIGTVDLLFHHGLLESEKALRGLGTAVRQAGEKEPVFALVASVGASAFLPFMPTPSEVDRILNLAADIVELVDDYEREPLMALARSALSAGLGTEQTRTAALVALTSTDAPPRAGDLEALLEQAQSGAWRAMAEVGPELFALVLGHVVAQVEMVARAIEAGAKAIVAAAEKALVWLGQQLENLRAELDRLIEEGARLLADMLADVRALADHLRTLATRVVDSVRDWVFSKIEPLMADFPDWAKQGLRDLLDFLFDGVSWLVTLPTQILGSVAGWVEEILTSSLASAAKDEQLVRDAVRREISGSQSPGLEFDLSLEVFGQKVFELPTIGLGGSDILGVIAQVVNDDPIYDQTVRLAANHAVELRGIEAQKVGLQGQIDGTLKDQDARTAVADLTPGLPLSISITAPEPLDIVRGETALTVTVAGANRTFLESVLGVPRRLRFILNGREYVFAAEHWSETTTGVGLRLQARIALPARPTATPPTVGNDAPVTLTAMDHSALTGVTARVIDRDQLELVATRPGAVTSTEGTEHSAPAAVVGGRVRLPNLRLSEVMAASQIHDLHVQQVTQQVTQQVNTQVNKQVDFSDIQGGQVRSVGSAQAVFDKLDLQPDQLVLHPEIQKLRAGTVAEPAPTDAQGNALLPGLTGLNTIQVAVSDGKGNQASESLVFVMAEEPVTPPSEPDRTPTVPGPSTPQAPARRATSIGRVEFDPPGPDWQGEYVEIRSTAPAPVELGGWTLRDLARHTYVFPDFLLAPGASVRVWTGPGDDDTENLFWGRRAAVWNNTGDVAVLSDATGREVARRVYLA